MRRMAHRALIVGAGNAGKAHAEALAELGVDHLGPLSGVAVAANTAPLFDPAIDIVHVTTANDLHVRVVSEALRARKHVVCEKPLAPDTHGAEQLAALALTSETRTTICQNYRFLPLVAELASRVRDGELGRVHLARGSFLQDWLLLISDIDWRVDASRGGMSRAVADIGVHWLDLVESITGLAVESVAAQVGYLHGRKTEDHAGLLVRFAGGLQGVCVLSQATAGHRNDLELSLDGDQASATWRGEHKDQLWIGGRDRVADVITRDKLRSPAARALAAHPASSNEGRRNLLAAFYGSLDGASSPVPLPSFDDGVRHVRFASAAIVSARTRAWVDVDSMRTTFVRTAP